MKTTKADLIAEFVANWVEWDDCIDLSWAASDPDGFSAQQLRVAREALEGLSADDEPSVRHLCESWVVHAERLVEQVDRCSHLGKS